MPTITKPRVRVPLEPVDRSCFADIGTYMKHFGGPMAARLDEALPPVFDPEREALSPHVAALAGERMSPFPAQAVAVQACVNTLVRHNVCFLVGEPGVGKTPLAGWIARVMQSRGDIGRAAQGGGTGPRYIRVAITCPNQLVKKWAAHMAKILPRATVTIVNKFHQLNPVLRPATGDEVYVIPRDRGKLSYAWRPAVIEKRFRESVNMEANGRKWVEWHTSIELTCPKCGGRQWDPKESKWAGPAYFARARRRCNAQRVNPVDGSKVTDNEGNAVVCGEPLWQAFGGTADARQMLGPPNRFVSNRLAMPKVHPRRVSPAEYAVRRRLRFDLYVADEVHEVSGKSSLQGGMFGDFAKCSDKVLCMTGTLTGGYAENLAFTLWRVMASRMRADGLTFDEGGETQFNMRYGVLQTTKRYIADEGQTYTDLKLGRGKQASKRQKVLPGISPLLFSRFLAGRAAFLRLQELHEHLPAYQEFLHSIPLDPDQAWHLDRMRVDFKAHIGEMKRLGQPCRAWSGAQAVFLRWPDRPWAPWSEGNPTWLAGRLIMGQPPRWTIYDRDEYGNPIEAFDVPEIQPMPGRLFPKERRLVRLLIRERLRGRKCIVFTEMTGDRWDVTNRLTEVLGRYGVVSALLKTDRGGGPKPEDRMEWIDEHTPGFDCIIANQELVKTGLDLYDHPTIIFYYTGYKTYTLRQAARRAWRLGQTQPCETHFLYDERADRLRLKQIQRPAESRKDEDGEPIDMKPEDYRSAQSAAMSLMASKMQSSLALEGDFSAEGLAAMSDSTDVQSQLARFIAGQLSDLPDTRSSFAGYRAALEASMPALAVKVQHPDARPAPMPVPGPGPVETVVRRSGVWQPALFGGDDADAA